MQRAIINDQANLQIQEQMSASDAYSIASSILEARIRYYRTLYLRHWEKDHSTSKDFYDKKIEALEQEKQQLADFAKSANFENKTINLSGNIDFLAV